MDNKRNRRTKADLDENLLEAAKSCIKEVGFSNATIVGITNKANIQPNVFYNRYNDLDDFFEKLVREYDYWLNDSIIIKEDTTPVQNYIDGANKLIDSFLENKIMQQLILWELNSNNFITRRTSENRERNSSYLIEYFSKAFKDSSVDFRVFTSIIISAIYYLVLHKNISSFGSVDFNEKESIALLKTTISNMVKKLYGSKDELKNSELQHKQRKTIKKLYDNGVDIEVIQKSFDMPIEIINSIIESSRLNENDSKIDDTTYTETLPKKKRGRPRKNKL